MELLSVLTRPARDLVRAVTVPLQALCVVGVCAAVDAMTSPGRWWVQWVALGMGIAVLLAWARAARTLLLPALVGFGGRWLLRRHGPAARAVFDAWVAGTQPQAAAVVRRLHALRTG